MILAVENPDAAIEAADHGRIKRVRFSRIEPPDGPAPRCGIERAERRSAIGAIGQFDQIVVDIAVAAEDFSHSAGAAERLPHVRANQTILEPAVRHAPVADQEIEIVCRAGVHGGAPRRLDQGLITRALRVGAAASASSGPKLTAARIGCGTSSVILSDRPESETIEPLAKGRTGSMRPLRLDVGLASGALRWREAFWRRLASALAALLVLMLAHSAEATCSVSTVPFADC